MSLGLEALAGVDASRLTALVSPQALQGSTSLANPPVNAPSTVGKTASASFADWLVRGVEDVNQGLVQSQTALQAVALGKTDNLPSVMIQLEQSRLQLMTLMQFRSRMLEAYQELMRMQI